MLLTTLLIGWAFAAVVMTIFARALLLGARAGDASWSEIDPEFVSRS
jgi:hypothetical protein